MMAVVSVLDEAEPPDEVDDAVAAPAPVSVNIGVGFAGSGPPGGAD
jgi:hypothetical protein